MTEPRIIPPEEARALADGLVTDTPWIVVEDDFEILVVEGRGYSPGVYSQIAEVGQEDSSAQLIAAAPDLAHTAAVLGEQREAALKLHKPVPWRHGGESGAGCSGCDWDYYPCPTARALGVEQL